MGQRRISGAMKRTRRGEIRGGGAALRGRDPGAAVVGAYNLPITFQVDGGDPHLTPLIQRWFESSLPVHYSVTTGEETSPSEGTMCVLKGSQNTLKYGRSPSPLTYPGIRTPNPLLC